MKINDTNYVWSTVDRLNPEEQGYIYEIEFLDTEDWDSERVCLAVVTDLLSAAITILDDLKIDKASSDTVEKIIAELRDKREYRPPECEGYAYYLNPMYLWRADEE